MRNLKFGLIFFRGQALYFVQILVIFQFIFSLVGLSTKILTINGLYLTYNWTVFFILSNIFIKIILLIMV